MRVKLLCSVILLCQLMACSGPKIQQSSGIVGDVKFEASSLIASDSYRLPFILSGNRTSPAFVVIAVHGFNDYSNAFKDYCAFIADEGGLCLAYDQRGFGETNQKGLWPAEGQLQSDLETFVRVLTDLYPNVPLFVSGESMGGAVIISALARNPLFFDQHVEGALLFAPAVWGRDTQPWYQRWALSLALNFVPSWKPSGDGLGIQASDNIDALRALGADPLVIKETRIDTIYGLTNLMDQALKQMPSISFPSVVFYGGNDQVIPPNAMCRMIDSLSEQGYPDFQFYPESYHMLTRDLDAPRLFRHAVGWMKGRRDFLSGRQPFQKFCHN